MPTAATPGHLWVSWDDYHRAIEDLAYKVHQSGWAFDQVLCLARGGLRPGDVFSRLFNVPLAVLPTSSYREAGVTVRGELDISAHIASTAGPLAGNILLVDDLVDSGVTLQTVQAYLPMHFRWLSKFALPSCGSKLAQSFSLIIMSSIWRRVRGFISRSKGMTI